jgi:hypothetical protein
MKQGKLKPIESTRPGLELNQLSKLNKRAENELIFLDDMTQED